MEWLKEYLREEKKKISELDGKARRQYIWQYYKLWIIGLAAVLVFVPTYVFHFVTTPGENWIYATFANTYTEVGKGSQLWEDFVAHSGYDTHEKNIVFNNNSYFDPRQQTYNEYYSAFVASVDSGTLDMITMEREEIESLGAYGRLMDLSNSELAGDLAQRYQDRLIYATPYDTEYSTEPIPIGIDLSDTCLVTEYHLYEDSCALGIGTLSTHVDAVEDFLEFVFDKEAAS